MLSTCVGSWNILNFSSASASMSLLAEAANLVDYTGRCDSHGGRMEKADERLMIVITVAAR